MNPDILKSIQHVQYSKDIIYFFLASFTLALNTRSYATKKSIQNLWESLQNKSVSNTGCFKEYGPDKKK